MPFIPMLFMSLLACGELRSPLELVGVTTASNSTVPLFAVERVPATGERTGYRLFDDGRYEELLQGSWQPRSSLDSAQTSCVKAAFDKQDLSSLSSTYQPDALPRGVHRKVWTLRVGGDTRRVEILGSAEPTALRAIDQALVSCKAPATVTTGLRVSLGAVRHELKLPCAPAKIPELNSAVMALLRPKGAAKAGAGSQDVIFAIDWYEGGTLTGRHELFSDGRRVRTALPGGEQIEASLSDQELSRVRQALESVPWQGLEGRCP